MKLRDLLFLCHARPKDEAQAALWKKLVENTLESPDTWEVALSAGKDKRENFDRLLREGKLGGLAVLRNLRLMLASGVDPKLIRERLDKDIAGLEKLAGLDWTRVSGSMNYKLSKEGETKGRDGFFRCAFSIEEGEFVRRAAGTAFRCGPLPAQALGVRLGGRGHRAEEFRVRLGLR